MQSPTLSEGFLCDAEAALAVFRDFRRLRGRRIDPTAERLKTLTITLDKELYRASKPYWMLKDNLEQGDDDDRVCGLALGHPVTSQLQELCLHRRKEWSYTSETFHYRPRLELLSCGATLRVLELIRCDVQPPALRTVLTLPSLTDLRLDRCFVSEGYLQAVVDAAPALTKLVLLNVKYKTAPDSARRPPSGSDHKRNFRLGFRLRCPTITALVLDYSRWNDEHEAAALAKTSAVVELDMPSLRSLDYEGFPLKLSLASPAPELTRVNIDTTARSRYGGDVEHCERTTPMLRSLSGMRSLTLHMRCVEEIMAGQDILPTFPNLNLLELKGEYEHMNSDTELAMASLLASCPVMSELRLTLNSSTRPDPRIFWKHSKKNPRGGALFAESMGRFKTLAYMMPHVQQDVNFTVVVSHEISELTALSSCRFTCLRKVTLQFRAHEMDCFPVQLAKFLVENAMELEEMHVDDGIQFWTDHLHNNLARWRADSFRRKNLPDKAGFRVYKSSTA